ncbi:hypothetical protein BSPWISOXPB_3034 [uncultured Gammaproteobacteria bacterium]|nr:hypothetical protein BSPWISOXPB_3034 [uncultured Gammaproteobacteria bacterium]
MFGFKMKLGLGNKVLSPEYGQKKALDLGAVRQQQFEYGYIFGAVCPAKDKALGLMLPVANTAGMIEHLRLISQATAKDRQALVIVDRAGWHMTKAIRCFSNVTLLPYRLILQN